MNTTVKINGRDITNEMLIDTLYFKVRVGEVASWGISFTGDTWWTRLTKKLYELRAKIWIRNTKKILKKFKKC